MAEIIINGPEGRLELRCHRSKTANAPLALVLHPHPEHGGTMNNKVTYALYRSFTDRGFSAVRFNFRGVGRSEGVFDQGEGELSDAATVLDWVQEQNFTPRSIWVAGFSFGAWIGMQLLMRRPELRGFISVSPPANMYDFTFLAPCPVSGQVIQGTRDDLVPKRAVDGMVERLSQQKGISVDYQTIDGADHFYTNCINDLMSRVGKYIEENISEQEWAVNL
jgi:hypothetical protein